MKETCLTENLLQMKLRHFTNQPVSPEKHSVATPTKSKKK